MRSIDYSTVRGSSKGSSMGSSKPVYKLNYKDKMRRVDEKYYDKLTCVIGDYKSIKQKSIRFPKNVEACNLAINNTNTQNNNTKSLKNTSMNAMQIKHQNSNTDLNKQIPLLDNKNDLSNNTINNIISNPNKQTKEEKDFNK